MIREVGYAPLLVRSGEIRLLMIENSHVMMLASEMDGALSTQARFKTIKRRRRRTKAQKLREDEREDRSRRDPSKAMRV